VAKTVNGGWSIPLADTAIGEEEVQAVSRVLRSGWLTAGVETEQFEREFAERMGVRHALAVSNGTAALHLANLVVGVRPGSDVLCPSLTFVATANASRYAGADVVFTDVVGPHDLTVDPRDIERKITSRTSAISVMHYAGFACDMTAICEIAARHDLPIIEDCAHAPMARCTGTDGKVEFVGTLGRVGCFSFFGNKNITTGEGGMLTTNDDGLADALRLHRSHGMTTASYDRFRGHAQDYDVTLLGYNYRIDDVRSAIGRVQLSKIDDLHARRRRVYRWYLEDLESARDLSVPFRDRDLELASPHIMSVAVNGDVARIRQRLVDAGIQSSRHYDLASSFSIYRDRRPGETPVAASLNLVTLPFAPGLTREQVSRVVSTIRED
jgi:dTDP-4-amino-4,6-dideoxygalactose transaminase